MFNEVFKMVIYQEDCEEFMRESKVYRNVLEHRRKCPKWGKRFCLECFGGGLTKFTTELAKENLKSPPYDETKTIK